MKRRFFRYIAGALIVAVIVCIFNIYTIPARRVAERNAVYLEQAGGYNRFVHKSLPDASWKEFVRPSPDLLYSYLVFDTRKSALLVEIPGYNDYWVNQMVDDETDSFAYVGKRSSGSNDVRFVLYSDKTPAFQVPEGYLSFKSPSPTGTFLLRYLVRSPVGLEKIETLRRQIKVKTIGS